MTQSHQATSLSQNHFVQNKSSSLYASLVLSLCAFFLFYKYIIQNFPSVISVQLMTDLDLQGLGLGMLSAGYFWTYLLVPLFVGVIIDRYGVRWVTSGAILICATGLWWFSHVQGLNTAILARALMGVGVSFATIAYMKLAATWFSPKRYALLIGLLVSAAMAGAVFGQMPLARLVQLVGWRNSLYDVSMAGLVLALFFLLIVREAPQSLHQGHEINSKPIGMREVMQVFRCKQNWLLMLYSGLSFSPVVIFCGLWGNPFLQTAYHINAISASSYISMVFWGLGLGSPLLAIFSHKLADRCAFMIYSTLISAVAITLVLYCHPLPTWLLGALLFIFGFSLGAFPLVFVIGKELNPLKLAGTAIAMINASEALLDAITEPVMGRVLDALNTSVANHGIQHFSLHSFHLVLAILPCYQIIGSLLLLKVTVK